METASARTRSPHLIAACTVLGILAIAALGFVDHRHEAAAALKDFAKEQVFVAQGIAASVSNGANGQIDVGPLEAPGDLVVLTCDAPGPTCRTSKGAEVHVTPIEHAFAAGDTTAQLDHPQAASVGLPPRMAHAGIASVKMPNGQLRSIVVVASALRERDREIRAEWRLVIGFLLTSACVLAFGAYALHAQRERLALSRELAVADAVRSRDERLVRADKLATLGAMATGIAHEVSTPLGVIVGRAEQLSYRFKDAPDDDRAKKSVDVIGEQATRIGAIVRAFLAFARGGAVSLEHLSARVVAERAAELVSHRFEAANVELDIGTRDLAIEDVQIACDETLFPQVLVNLLLNACDACEDGGTVRLHLNVEGDKVRFVIVDDGSGITAEDAARATEPFFTTKPVGRGTGIGLSIAHEIVLHHGGTLRLAPRGDGVPGTEAIVEIARASSGTPSAREEAT